MMVLHGDRCAMRRVRSRSSSGRAGPWRRAYVRAEPSRRRGSCLVLVQLVLGPGPVDEDQTRNDRRVSRKLRPMRCSTLAWPMTGSTAERRRNSPLMAPVAARSRARNRSFCPLSQLLRPHRIASSPTTKARESWLNGPHNLQDNRRPNRQIQQTTRLPNRRTRPKIKPSQQSSRTTRSRPSWGRANRFARAAAPA
jgi:hypothetical protein